MDIKVKSKLKFENVYTFTLTDAKTGKVKFQHKDHNVVVNNCKTNMVSGASWRMYLMPYELWVGTGTGTPAVTDTNLFTKLTDWSKAPDTVVKTYEGNTSIVNLTYTYPASASYVATISEVGLSSYRHYEPYVNYGQLYTHCLLKDAEGNPITITKTDLDILTINIEVRLTLSLSSAFTAVLPATKQPLAAMIANNGSNNLSSYIGTLGLTTLKHLLGTENPTGLSVTSFSWDSATSTIKAPTTRVAVGSGNTRFYNSIYISNIGLINLPNAAVFPQYTISGIAIGVGDGVKTDFDCPISYFVAESDQVYKDGVLLTRGTDYTIDNIQNKGLFSELTPIMDADFSGLYNQSGGYRSTPWFYPADIGSWDYTKQSITGRYLMYNLPILIDMKTPVTCNTIQLGGLGNSQYYSTSSPSADYHAYELYYSTDNTNWTKIADIGTGNKQTANMKVTFADTTARYWKVVGVGLSTSDVIVYNPDGNNYFSFLGKVGSPIHFTTAPATGAVITMNCGMDRPFKNSNFVIDMGMQLSI